MQGYRPDTYGEAFADVYDDWYHDVSPAGATADFVATRTSGRVLELGSGTGRLAAPLAGRGLDVVGLDVSVAMLASSRRNHPTVPVVGGDMVSLPVRAGGFGAALIAFNTLFNVPTPDLQRVVLGEVARVLDDGGILIVETFVPGDVAGPTDAVDVVRMDAVSVVLRASRSDPRRSVVSGHHIELRDGEPVRLRPWHLCYCSPDVLDERAADAGLLLQERYADWDAAPFSAMSEHQVAVYRRARRHR